MKKSIPYLVGAATTLFLLYVVYMAFEKGKKEVTTDIIDTETIDS